MTIVNNWSQAGCTVVLEPRTEETLLEWQCPAGYAAELTSYKVGIADDYISLPHNSLQIKLAFATVLAPRAGCIQEVIHIDPNPYKLQKFSTKVRLVAYNKTDEPLEVWGSFKGNTTAVASVETIATTEATEEIAMIDDTLENSQVGMKKLAPTALGIVASSQPNNLPTYDEGEAAALLTDQNGRLLVSIDALTPEAESQLSRLSEHEIDMQERLLEAQADAERQRTENQLRILQEQNKHARKQSKIAVRRAKVDNACMEATTKSQGYVDTAIKASQYDFLSTLVRWSVAAVTTLSLVYLLS